MTTISQFLRKSLPRNKLPLLLSLGLGGLLVLGSYLGCYLHYGPRVLLRLWGNISDMVRYFYLFSMMLCVLGFIVLRIFLIKLDPSTKVMGVPFLKSQWWYCAAIGLFLLPSALWMPASMRYLQQPSQLLQNAVRAILWIVAAGGLGLTYLVSQTQTDSIWKRLSQLGTVWLSFHLVFLDAIYWPSTFFVRE